MAEMDAATVLEEAADLLLIRGRRKDSGFMCDYLGPEDPLCVLAAVAEVQGLHHWGAAMETPAAEAVALHLGPSWEPREVSRRAQPVARRVWNWNDSTDDDFEVIDTLRRVAKDIRNAEVPA